MSASPSSSWYQSVAQRAWSSQLAASVVLPQPGGPVIQVTGMSLASTPKRRLRGNTPPTLGRVVLPSDSFFGFISFAPHRPVASRVGASTPAAGDSLDPVQAANQRDFIHLVAASRQFGGEFFVPAAELDDGGAVTRAEVGQLYSALHVQAPVQRADQRLGHIVDDHRPARGTHGELDFVVGVENNGGGHAAPRSFARRDGIRPARREIEIGELVVEQKARSEERRVGKESTCQRR